FLADKPILARPVTRAEHAWRWCRRKPLLTALSAATLALLLAVAIGSPIALLRISQARAEAVRDAMALRSNLYLANINAASEAVQREEFGKAKDLLKFYLTHA